MKAILAVIIMCHIALVAKAQEPVDTVATTQLQEVVVKAPKVIRKADMDVYYPSSSATENSKNGLQLLNNLMIPALSVTEALNTVTSAGTTVQIRINGRESSVEQLRTLLPSTIKRVEWIDNPGLRYKGAEAVLNFIVANPNTGGSLMTEARPALNAAWGLYMADAKINSSRSQFAVGGYYKLTNRLKAHRNYHETFTFPDGSSFTRNETSLGGGLDNSAGRFGLSYNYVIPDTTVIMIDIASSHKFSDRFEYNGLLSLSTGQNDILLNDMHGDKGTTPIITAYWEQHFKHRQSIVVDFSSSLYFGKTYSNYIERLPESIDYLTYVNTSIRDRNQVYGIQANYIKHWKNSRLTTGISYTANRNRSVYENLNGSVFHQRQDRVYFFAEYFQRINKFTLTAGLGAQYTDFLFRETNQGNHSWNLRPQATLSYAINMKHQLRLNFETWQSAPSLAETNIAPQQLDGFQWKIGNPNLKTSNSYMLTLRYNFMIPRISGSFGIRAYTSPNAITPYQYWDDNRLITSYENSRGLQNLSFFIAPQIEIIPKWLMASGYLQYRMERMRGTEYKLHNYNWSGNINLQLTHWNFVLMGMYVRSQHDLWGEKISWGENISLIDLSYTWKEWQFGAGMIMPFGRYDQGSKMIGRWDTNEQHMRLDMRMPYLKIAYNVQWGRQKRSVEKRVNADAKVDSSTAGGR